MTRPSERDAEFYDDRWTDPDVSHAKRLRAQRIRDVIGREATQPLEILELGCGTGWLCNELSRFGSCLGVDLSSRAIEQAQRSFPHARFACVDLGSWSADGAYDVVVSHEVIEHLRDQRRHIELARDALKPGGILVLTTPNAFAAYRSEATVRHAYELQPIESWLYPDELEALLERTGLTIEESTTIVAWRSYRNRLLRLLASSRLDAVASRMGTTDTWARAKGRLNLNATIFVVARRR
jgi:2-polyprenyl-3-methyl-5-hydroxy-6-metoxy-1,4-benzoquinol methylase